MYYCPCTHPCSPLPRCSQWCRWAARCWKWLCHSWSSGNSVWAGSPHSLLCSPLQTLQAAKNGFVESNEHPLNSSPRYLLDTSQRTEWHLVAPIPWGTGWSLPGQRFSLRKFNPQYYFWNVPKARSSISFATQSPKVIPKYLVVVKIKNTLAHLHRRGVRIFFSCLCKSSASQRSHFPQDYTGEMK